MRVAFFKLKSIIRDSRCFNTSVFLSQSSSRHDHRKSLQEPSKFWDMQARKVDWFKKYERVLTNHSYPLKHDHKDTKAHRHSHSRWFENGILNTCFNCLDRHIFRKDFDKNKTAIIYDSPVTSTIREISYLELYNDVVVLSSLLRSYGLKKGDRVVIYMPNIPETACARLGLIHCVVFGGFAAPELAVRIKDCKPELIISSSCGIDGQKVIDYKILLDKAIELSKSDPLNPHEVKKCLILQRNRKVANLIENRDFDMLEEMKNPSLVINTDCEPLLASDPLYILYTSGTTGTPKGVVRDTGGHAVALRYSMESVYGLAEKDRFWAASDVGWVVGHSYSVYGPLLLGCTTLLYEGKPVGTPDEKSFWRVIERHKINALFTAPTALRAIKRIDEHGESPSSFDLSSLRTLFLAGERADPDTIKWAEKALKVPVRDHWWQTETGWPICANSIGDDGYIPIKVQILDEHHEPVGPNVFGNIAIRQPTPPGVMLTLYNNDLRFVDSYLNDIPGYFNTGDAGYIDEDGYVFVMSRTDDVINVAGHRLSSGAIEEILSDHPDIAEVAVIGVKDQLKGQLPLALILLNSHCTRDHQVIISECVTDVRNKLGALACFRDAVVVNRLPKTRSGKILRATMRSIANGDKYKIPATIDDVSVLDEIVQIIASRNML